MIVRIDGHERTQTMTAQPFVVSRKDRAPPLNVVGEHISLAEIAVCARFSDQSQFPHHFKRVVGVTPGQFRTLARIA
jgi:AraC-like DNA-binding protein